eukprot:1154013-Pelagomonas_calceolata.AAC.1
MQALKNPSVEWKGWKHACSKNLAGTFAQHLPVSHKFDVLHHQLPVHANQVNWQCFRNELLLNGHSLHHNFSNALSGHAVIHQAAEQSVRVRERDCLHPPVQEASKVAVQALIAGDELIGEGKARHEATLLQPEDGAEGAREEDALHAGKSNQALVEML